jgi:ParB family chromosome partitioning protein
MSENQVVQMPVEQLESNPLQPRGVITPESLVELVASIKKHGILEPLVVAHTPAGYQLIAGERRWRAAKIAGLKVVPIIIRQTTPRGMLEMALVENIQREDLNPIERAKAFDRLVQEFNLTLTKVAGRVSKSVAYVSNSLKLLKLPDALKDGLLSGLITEGHARALFVLGESKLMIEGYKLVLREGASVRRAEEIARRLKKQKLAEKPTKSALSRAMLMDEEVEKVEERIKKGLGVGNNVSLARSKRQTKLTIVLKGDLEETDKRLKVLVNRLVNV